MLRVVPGLGVVTLLCPSFVIACPLDGGTGEVPGCSIQMTPNGANDALGNPFTRFDLAPESIVGEAKHFTNMSALLTACVVELVTHYFFTLRLGVA